MEPPPRATRLLALTGARPRNSIETPLVLCPVVCVRGIAVWRWAMRFILGLLLGVALGVSLGLLVAPQPGSETRRALRERVHRAGEDAEEAIPS